MKKPKFEMVVKDFCLVAYKKIKEALETNVDREVVLNSVISDDSLSEILKEIKFDYHSRSRLIAKRCLEVIAVSLVQDPPDYKTLLNQLKHLTNLSENRIYIYIKIYLPILADIIEDLDISKWLPKEHKEPYKYEEVKELARKIGAQKNGIEGKILTSKEEYEKSIQTQNPSHTHVLVTCNIERHKPWKITPNNLSRSKWCRKCYREGTKLQYEDIQQMAKHLGREKVGIPGTLLTTKEEFEKLTEHQKPSQTRLKFYCNVKGHNPWESTANRLRERKWCPECSGSYYESIARWYLEQIFNVKFPTTRLKDVIPNHSGVMHFDGFAELIINQRKIRIAFEYNGRQHYEFPNQFHKKLKEFLKRKKYDYQKEVICESNNIILIIIPYTISPESMQDYIIEQFESKTGLELPKSLKFNHQTRFIQSTTLNNFL